MMNEPSDIRTTLRLLTSEKERLQTHNQDLLRTKAELLKQVHELRTRLEAQETVTAQIAALLQERHSELREQFTTMTTTSEPHSPAQILRLDPDLFHVQLGFPNGVLGNYALEELNDAEGKHIKLGKWK